MTLPFKPTFDNVVLKIIKEKQKDNIILTDNQKKILALAEVVAVGPGKYDVHNKEYLPTALEPGQKVFINSLLGMDFKINKDHKYRVQKEDEIRIVLTGDLDG